MDGLENRKGASWVCFPPDHYDKGRVSWSFDGSQRISRAYQIIPRPANDERKLRREV